jgi:hypothetical protein
MTTILQLLAFLTLTCCQPGEPKITLQNADGSTTKDLVLKNSPTNNSDTLQILCDSIYKAKGYKITLITFDEDNEDETTFNAVFTLWKFFNGQYKPIFSDSIYNKVQEVKFADFNHDKVKDILVQNFSDVRSNWTYYLYLVDTTKDKLKKIKGFEEIKNPAYIPAYDLIDNYVMSGRNWTSFYKIKDGGVLDFGIVVYDGEDDNGKVTYDNDYNKAIKKILTKKNNR